MALNLAVLQTWVHLYYKACARKQATLAKHANAATKGCLLEKQGWLAATKDFLGGLFSGVEDPCEAYYTAAMVDPAWEVGLIDAFVESFSAGVQNMLQRCSAADRHFFILPGTFIFGLGK